MNRTFLKMIIALLCMNAVNAFGQTSDELSPCINYNYQNKLRFEWPVSEKKWSVKNNYLSILLTKNYAKFIVENANKFDRAITNNESAIIKIEDISGLMEVEINSFSNPVKYLFKDSLQIFIGIHQIQLQTRKDSEIRIFFDKATDLYSLTEIDFDSIYSRIVYDLNESEKYSPEEVKNSKDIMYQYVENKIINSGIIGREKRIVYGGTLSFGAMLTNLEPGFGLSAEFSRIRYDKSNTNRNLLSSKFSLQQKYYIFNSGSYVAYSFTSLDANRGILSKTGFELSGVGIGYYWFSQDENTQEGLSVSLITESHKIYISYDTTIPLKNKDLFNLLSLTFGFKF